MQFLPLLLYLVVLVTSTHTPTYTHTHTHAHNRSDCNLRTQQTVDVWPTVGITCTWAHGQMGGVNNQGIAE